MKIVSISDIHMREEGDFCEKALFNFMEHELVQASDMIVFNGDIFDYASGFHPGYWARFKRYFQSLKKLLLNSKKIVFIEGNHDIHLEKVFRRFIQTFNGDQENFVYVTKSIIIEAQISQSQSQGQSQGACEDKYLIYFSHGDEIPGSKQEYIKYKNIIRSRALQVISNLLPLRFFDFLALKASGDSRKRSSKYNEEDTKAFYAKAVISLRKTLPQVNDFVLGHSHVEESSSYFNTGFSPQTRKFFYFDGRKSSLQTF